jgi:rhomboid protease GluP
LTGGSCQHTPGANRDESGPTHSQQDAEQHTLPYVTLLLLTVNIVVYLAMWAVAKSPDVSSVAVLFGDKQNEMIREGQIWRFVTPIFLHGNLAHLLSNSLSLFWLGTQLERIYGARKYFLIYMIAGISGYLLSYFRSPIPSLGASGAIFGLVGAGLIFPIRFRARIPEKARSQILSQLLIVTLINLGIGYYAQHIDNMAHMGGLVGGGFAALFLIPDVLQDEREAHNRAANRALTAAVTIMLAIIAWSVFRQAQWARENLPPRMKTYALSVKDPWWTVSVPDTWRQLGTGWRSPEGALLQVEDSGQDPTRVAEALALVQQAGPHAERTSIDGQQAAHLTLRQQQIVLELYLIRTDRGLALISLECPLGAYPKARRDFGYIVRYFHFRR